jgi:RNA polymerase sigma factor (TIGR02999 family)
LSEVTQILESIQHGNPNAAENLLPLVYKELRCLAAQKMARERPGHTLQPTALVHEAWLRLVGNSTSDFKNRAHFFAAAAESMRRILVEAARRKSSQRRGGQMQRAEVEPAELPLPMPADELMALDEALNRLADVDSRAAEVVKLCFFVGLTQAEAAQQLQVSVSTVERLWVFARAWLFGEMQQSGARTVELPM